MLKYNQNDAKWAVIAQFFSVIFFPPLFWLFYGKWIAASVALGGGICLVPNIYLYRSVFQYFGASQAKNMFKALCLGELVKIFLTVLLFITVLSYLPWVLPLYLFIGYILTQGVFWLGPLFWGIIKKNL